jgi:hypothetical protein
MKRVNPWIVVCVLLTAGWSVSDQDGSQARTEALEKRVEALEKYAQAQAKAAEALARALNEADEQGFTYGINPESRKVLLAGMREAATAAQQGVPGAPVVPAPTPAPAPTPVPVPKSTGK